MPNVVLVFDRDCPNVEAARANLREALGSERWSEWERSDPSAPAELRDLGSPTVLVDGRPVGGVSSGGCCRLYEVGDRLVGAPSIEAIAHALRAGG